MKMKVCRLVIGLVLAVSFVAATTIGCQGQSFSEAEKNKKAPAGEAKTTPEAPKSATAE